MERKKTESASIFGFNHQEETLNELKTLYAFYHWL